MNNPTPFKGLRIVDFAWLIAGPLPGKYFGMYGAEVIRIESRKRVDGARMQAPFQGGKPGMNRSGSYANTNANKLDIGLDMSNPKGLEIARQLVSTADVVVENFAPGVMKKWGLDYEGVHRLRPDAIMISLSMQGQSGPAAHGKGVGHMLQGLVGINQLSGWPEGAPVGPAEPYTDLTVPWFAIISIIAALEQRMKTGQGQYIDLSQYEVGLYYVAPALLDYEVNGRIQTRTGNRVAEAAPHGVFHCQGQERYVAIAVHTDQEWKAFCQAIGSPAWTREPRFSTFPLRKQNEDELDRLVSEWTSQRAPEQVMDTLQKAGVAAGTVARGQDLHQDPQLKARGHFWPLEHPTMGLRPYDGPAFRLSKAPARMVPAPLLGQHTEFVCKQVLGMPDGEFKQLTEAHILE